MQTLKTLFERLGGLGGSAAIHAWMRTLEYKAAFYDQTIDPVDPGNLGRKIYIFWHENILLPIYLRGHCNIVMLLSRHRDAEVLSHAAEFLGFSHVRGSTFGGAYSALRELMRESEQFNLAITCDGPRGPRRVLAQGAIYLAAKLGLPLVPMGFGYDRPWRLRSWDRFAIPRPYSRARAVLGPAIRLPADLDRATLERERRRIERILNLLTNEAEAWAIAGTPKIGETALRREPARARKSAAACGTIHIGDAAVSPPRYGTARRTA